MEIEHAINSTVLVFVLLIYKQKQSEGSNMRFCWRDLGKRTRSFQTAAG